VATYPLVVRNPVPGLQRAFVLLWVQVLLLVTWSAGRTGPPDGTKWWPLILLLFWIVGLFALRRAFDAEAGQLRIEAPRQARVRRGRPFARRDETLPRLDLTIVDTDDGDGTPYFHLIVGTPGGLLLVRESHRRAYLEALKARAERAWSPARNDGAPPPRHRTPSPPNP